VVVQVQGQILGFIVDAVSDVLTVTGADIQPTPDLHGQVDAAFFTGLAKVREKLVILLNINTIPVAGGKAQAVQAAASRQKG
jgi:purine-binding chemotaxis protein CheW